MKCPKAKPTRRPTASPTLRPTYVYQRYITGLGPSRICGGLADTVKGIKGTHHWKVFVPKHGYNSRRALYIDVDTTRCRFEKEIKAKQKTEAALRKKDPNRDNTKSHLAHPIYSVTMIGKAKRKKVQHIYRYRYIFVLSTCFSAYLCH
jgi:hypothetical protein